MPARTIVITGASDGIGAAAAKRLSGHGDRLLLVGRSEDKMRAVAEETGAQYFLADFSRLADVRALAQNLQDTVGDSGIDVLANNAGGIFGDQHPTVDGHEKTFQVNHLGPFLLTTLLMPQLLANQAAVINTSSIGHRIFGQMDINDLNNRRNFSAHKAYGDAKLANVLFTGSLHAKFADQGLTSVAFHPGNVRTNFAEGTTSAIRLLYRTRLKRLMLIGPDKGGSHLEWFINGTPGETWVSGQYYDQRSLTAKVNPQIHDAELAEALWQRSLELTSAPETK